MGTFHFLCEKKGTTGYNMDSNSTTLFRLNCTKVIVTFLKPEAVTNEHKIRSPQVSIFLDNEQVLEIEDVIDDDSLIKGYKSFFLDFNDQKYIRLKFRNKSGTKTYADETYSLQSINSLESYYKCVVSVKKKEQTAMNKT